MLSRLCEALILIQVQKEISYIPRRGQSYIVKRSGLPLPQSASDVALNCTQTHSLNRSLSLQCHHGINPILKSITQAHHGYHIRLHTVLYILLW